MNSRNSEWKEDISMNISPNSSDTSPRLDTELMNLLFSRSSSKDCPRLWHVTVSKWTIPIHGMNGKSPLESAKKCTSGGDRSWESRTQRGTSLPQRKKT